MSDQPEALRLADLLQDECGVDGYVHDEAAALLRRQHAEIESAHQAQRDAENELSRALARHAMAESALKAERDALRADAERYRYWRKHHGWTGYFDDGASNSEKPSDVDAAIDAAKEARK